MLSLALLLAAPNHPVPLNQQRPKLPVKHSQKKKQTDARAEWVAASGAGYSIRLHQVAYSTKAGDSPTSWWGALDGKPLVVTQVTLKHGKEVIRVPRSAYADLANVNGVVIKQLKTGCEFLINGSDASEGYRCRYFVKNDQLVKRVVASGEFPENNSETTTYVNKEIKDN